MVGAPELHGGHKRIRVGEGEHGGDRVQFTDSGGRNGKTIPGIEGPRGEGG